MEAIEAILTRRSVRNFIEKDIPPDKIIKIQDCAVRAPSASNMQPWEFILIKDQEVKDEFRGY